MQRVEGMEKTFGFNESTPSYDIICKIKGDFWLFKGYKETQASIMHYERNDKLLRSNHPKKPLI